MLIQAQRSPQVTICPACAADLFDWPYCHQRLVSKVSWNNVVEIMLLMWILGTLVPLAHKTHSLLLELLLCQCLCQSCALVDLLDSR